jgi:hydroxymethylpyrimidine pyrophosphatase-like HAD family hydrolase
MLNAVGTGIAMGNAEDVVKKAADHVTSGVDDEGIWKGLKEHQLI